MTYHSTEDGAVILQCDAPDCTSSQLVVGTTVLPESWSRQDQYVHCPSHLGYVHQVISPLRQEP